MGRFVGQGLSCARGGRMVFARLGFDVGPGEALLLLGPNGSGKSSLLRLMAGLARPAAGTLGFDGAPIDDDPEAHHARLHYLGHLDGVKAALTVAENLSYWSGLRGTAADVAGALDRVGLAALADLPARLLSAGQRRRLALARLLAAPAPLWLLDEPSVALDRDSVAALEREIAAHRAAGGTTVVSTNVDLGIGDAVQLHLPEFATGADGDAWAPAP